MLHDAFLPNKGNNGNKLKNWLPWYFLLAGLSATLLGLIHFRQSTLRDWNHDFTLSCDEIETKIRLRMDAHQQILLSGAAFLESVPTVSREDWRHFVLHQKIGERFPGIQGIGFALAIPAKNITQHIDDIRAEGFPAYTVWPMGERGYYTSIIFLEPFSDRNLRAFGYDMFFEPVRREAMERARDTDEPALSGKVILVQETEKDVQAGTLMYVPVFHSGMPIETTSQRRDALRGWAYSPYRMDDLMKGILGNLNESWDRKIRLEIFDGDRTSPDSLLFDSLTPSDEVPEHRPVMTVDIPFMNYGQLWILRFSHYGLHFIAGRYGSVLSILVVGMAFSFLLFRLSMSMLHTRSDALNLAALLTRDLQESNERMSLATRAGKLGIWDYDFASDRLNWDDGMRKLYGMDAGTEGLAHKDWLRFVHPDDAERCAVEMQSTLSGDSEFDSEFRIIRPDGVIRTMHAFGMLQKDPDGRPLRLIGTNSDTTERTLVAEALQKAKKRYEDLARNIPAGIYLLRSDSKETFTFEYVSPRMAEILDLDAGSILADPWAAFKPIHPEDIEEFIRLNKEAVHLRQIFTWEGRIFIGGSVRWIRISSFPEPQGNGECFWNGIMLDITEEKMVQEALRESEEKFRDIAEKIETVIFITDREGTLDYISPAAEHVFGWPPGEMIGRKFMDFLQESEIPRALQAFRDYIITGNRQQDLSLLMKRRDGGVFEGELNSSLLEKGDNTKGTLGLIRDITERKRMERQLREKDEGLATAQRLAKIGSWKWISSTGSMQWSEQLYEILGYDPESPVPAFTRMEPFFTPDSWRRLNEKIGSFFTLDLELIHPDGKARYVIARCEPDTDADGNMTGMHGTMQDISERKLAEIRIRGLLEEKELILKEVHHRIKNNMNTIKSLLSLQAASMKNPVASSALEEAAGRIRSMAALYDKLYQSNDYGTISAKYYLGELIDEILSNFPITIPITVDKRIDDIVLDVKRVQTLSIIMNELLTNIMKYAFTNRERGTIFVSVSAKGKLLTMIIQDDGEGMPSTVDFKNSPGFGIMLVGALTDQLEGNIRIDRVEGTRITLDFPA